MIYNNDIYGGGGRGALSREKSRDVSSELTLPFVIMPTIANNDEM